MVGGGQLARMTHQAGIPLGIRFSSSATPRRLGGPGGPRCRRRRLSRPRHVCGDFAAGLRRDHLRPRARTHRAPAGAGGGRHARAPGTRRPGARPGQGRDAAAARRDRRALPAVAAGVDPRRCGRFRRGRWAGRSSSRPSAAGTTARACGSPENDADASALVAEAALRRIPLLAEEKVDFVRELAAIVARSPHGQASAYPVVESVQVDGVCREVIAPAPGIAPGHAAAAQEVALRIAGELGVIGVLAVELFETKDGGVRQRAGHAPAQLRPLDHRRRRHQPVREACAGRPGPAPRATRDAGAARRSWSTSSAATAGHVLRLPALHGPRPAAQDPHVRQGRSEPGRKVGHVNIAGDDLDEVRERARHAAAYLRGDIHE